jgi:hypothetical protein
VLLPLFSTAGDVARLALPLAQFLSPVICSAINFDNGTNSVRTRAISARQRGRGSTSDKCGWIFWPVGGGIAATARALRIQRPGGRYHVTARGNERKAIYREESDRTHFLELLGELTERLGLRVHTYVLMDSQFHVLVQTPEANLSRAMR